MSYKFVSNSFNIGANDLGGYKRKVIALTNVSTTSRVLLDTETGSVVTVDNSTDSATTVTVTLPTAAAGLQYTFCILKNGTNTSADIIITTGANGSDFFGVIQCDDDNFYLSQADPGGGLPYNVSKLTIDMTNRQTCGGMLFEVLCDGTHWFIMNSHIADSLSNALLSSPLIVTSTTA